jgi:hypothetical protein
MDLVEFKFSLPRPWPTGKYRFELKSTNGLQQNLAFEVK